MSAEEFIPVNRLEELLLRSTQDDEAAQPLFFKALLEDLMIAPGKVEDGRDISFESWVIGGVQSIPIFTSRERLTEALEKTGFEVADVVLFSGEKLLKMIPDEAPVVINPVSKAGYKLVAEARRDLLDGTLFKNYGV